MLENLKIASKINSIKDLKDLFLRKLIIKQIVK